MWTTCWWSEWGTQVEPPGWMALGCPYPSLNTTLPVESESLTKRYIYVQFNSRRIYETCTQCQLRSRLRGLWEGVAMSSCRPSLLFPNKYDLIWKISMHVESSGSIWMLQKSCAWGILSDHEMRWSLFMALGSDCRCPNSRQPLSSYVTWERLLYYLQPSPSQLSFLILRGIRLTE